MIFLSSFVSACGSAGKAADEQSPQSRAAIERYRAYLEGKSTELLSVTQQLGALIKAGETSDAQPRYASARVIYGQLEPAAESFGGLDSRLDSTAGDVPERQLTGFHRVERELWTNPHNPALASLDAQLLADVATLRRKLSAVRLSDAQIVEGAQEVLREVSASEIHGNEEPYSHIDLVDIAANVEGVEAAFKAVEPAVEEADPTLAAEIRSKFESAYTGVKHFGLASREPYQPRPESPGTSFVLYEERTQAEFHELDRRIQAVAQLLARVQDEVLGP